MDEPFEFEDDAAEALLSGRGAGVDPSVAGLLDDVRGTFDRGAPAVGLELSAFLRDDLTRVRARSRVGFAAKAAAIVAAALATTGGLAVAGALPAPVQSAFSRAASEIGVHVPGDDHSSAAVVVEAPTSTTTDEPTTVAPPENTTVVPERHGDVVSGVAHSTDVQGCDHGRAVSAVASGKTNTKPCPHTTTTTTTTPDTSSTSTTTTTTTVAGHGQSQDPHGKGINGGAPHAPVSGHGS
jgi:hypothetical protein